MPLLSTPKVYKKAAFKQIVRSSQQLCQYNFFKKMFVLKAAFYSNPISHFKHLQRRNFWENLQIFMRMLLLSRYVKNVLFIY